MSQINLVYFNPRAISFKGWFSLEHKHRQEYRNRTVRFSCVYVELVASENSTRQINGFVLLMFLLMLMIISQLFSLVLMR